MFRGRDVSDIEQPYTLSNFSDPYQLMSAKRAYILAVHQQIMGRPPPPKNIMSYNGALPNSEQQVQNMIQNNGERMTPEEFKGLGEFLFRGIKGLSRFASNKYFDGDMKEADARLSTFRAGGNFDFRNRYDFDPQLGGFQQPLYENLSFSRTSQTPYNMQRRMSDSLMVYRPMQQYDLMFTGDINRYVPSLGSEYDGDQSQDGI